MLVRSKAPFRISFGGGGTDVPPYCWEYGGAVLNVAVNRYAYASLSLGGEKIVISSIDLTKELEYAVSKLPYDGNLDLIKAVANYFNLDQGSEGRNPRRAAVQDAPFLYGKSALFS